MENISEDCRYVSRESHTRYVVYVDTDRTAAILIVSNHRTDV